MAGIICSLALSGCGRMGTTNGSASVSINAPANRSALPPANPSHAANRVDPNHRTSGNVTMDGEKNPASAQHTEIVKVLINERNGLEVIENDAHQGLWTDAWRTVSVMNDEFVRAVLPVLSATKGNTYANGVHGQLDALRNAVESRNKAETFKLVQVNRASLHVVANALGVSLLK